MVGNGRFGRIPAGQSVECVYVLCKTAVRTAHGTAGWDW